MDKELEQMFTIIIQGMTDMEKRINARFDTIETDLKAVKLRQEQEILPAIQKLADGYVLHSEILDEIRADIKPMKEDISLLKSIAVSQRDELHEHDRVIQVLKSIN